MSVGYTSAFNSSHRGMSMFVRQPDSPGGAIRGWMPQTLLLTDKRYPEYEQIRYILTNSWNNHVNRQLREANMPRSMTTPFRAVMNAGDLLSRESYACGGATCASVQSRPNVHGIRSALGGNTNKCMPTVVYSSLQMNRELPAAACNVKFVYDSSDYTTFLKQKAVLKNYNALSNGGNEFSGNQSAFRAIRRY